MEELHPAIAGLSDVCILADHARYLQMPADMWFEWSPKMREKHVFGVQKLSVEDVFKQKDVPWPVVESADIDSTEFRPLEVDIITELIWSLVMAILKKMRVLKKKKSYTSW